MTVNNPHALAMFMYLYEFEHKGQNPEAIYDKWKMLHATDVNRVNTVMGQSNALAEFTSLARHIVTKRDIIDKISDVLGLRIHEVIDQRELDYFTDKMTEVLAEHSHSDKNPHGTIYKSGVFVSLKDNQPEDVDNFVTTISLWYVPVLSTVTIKLTFVRSQTGVTVTEETF